MKKTLAPLLAGLMLALTLAGCGAPAPGPSGGSGSSTGAPGGTDIINIVMFGSPDGFMPYLGSGGMYTTTAANGLIYEALTKLDGDFNVQPCLAADWTVSEDSLTYTFNLRRDVKWQDGTPFTAGDVLFTFKMILDPRWTGTGSPYLMSVKGAEAYKNGQAGDVEGLAAPDDYTVVVTMEQPYAPFLECMQGSLPILPAHMFEGLDIADYAAAPIAKAPMGTGPCVFGRYVTDQYVEYDMNRDYYGGTPKFDKLILKIMNSDLALLAFEKGELDITTNVAMGTMPAADYDLLMDMDAVKVVTFETSGIQFMTINYAKKELADPRFRQAVSYAIDRETMAAQLLGTLGTPAYTSVPPFSPYYKGDTAPLKYDPDKARALLADLGWDQSRVLTLQVPRGEVVRERMAPIVQQYLAAAGIQVELQFGEFASILPSVSDKSYDLAFFGTGSTMIDPDAAYYSYFYSGQTRDAGGWNMGGYQNADMDRLLDAGRATADTTRRKELYGEVQDIEAGDPNFINFYFEKALAVVSNRVTGVTPSASGFAWDILNWEVAA